MKGVRVRRSKNDTHEYSKGKVKKQKSAVHSERAAKKRRMAAMSEEA